jgi:hypothetical protein
MGEDPHESGHRAGQATRAVTGEGGDLLAIFARPKQDVQLLAGIRTGTQIQELTGGQCWEYCFGC